MAFYAAANCQITSSKTAFRRESLLSNVVDAANQHLKGSFLAALHD